MSTPDARTASPSPLSPTAFLADEAALRRAFDSEFAQCLASAKTQLGQNTLHATGAATLQPPARTVGSASRQRPSLNRDARDYRRRRARGDWAAQG